MIAPIRPPLVKRSPRRSRESPLERARRAVADSLLSESESKPVTPGWRSFWVFSGWLLLVTAAVVALWLR